MNQVDEALQSISVVVVSDGHRQRYAAAPVCTPDAGFGLFDPPVIRQGCRMVRFDERLEIFVKGRADPVSLPNSRKPR
jgi:hypothetical protein